MGWLFKYISGIEIFGIQAEPGMCLGSAISFYIHCLQNAVEIKFVLLKWIRWLIRSSDVEFSFALSALSVNTGKLLGACS